MAANSRAHGPMSANLLTPRARAVDAGPAGWGSVAVAAIRTGEVVATFGGMPCRLSVLAGLPPDRRSRSIQIDDNLYLAGPPEREPGDCMNHSCDPNCGPLGAATIVAIRDIAPGETLTFDYGTTDGSDYDEFDCVCKTTMCRRRIRGTDWRLASLRERHGARLSPYLIRRIRTQRHGRPLVKADVEQLTADYDADPSSAIADALGIVLSRPFSALVDLVDALRLEGGLGAHEADLVAAGDVGARDRLVMRLVEARGADLLEAFSVLPG